jgi:hypothetical protein
VSVQAASGVSRVEPQRTKLKLRNSELDNLTFSNSVAQMSTPQDHLSLDCAEKTSESMDAQDASIEGMDAQDADSGSGSEYAGSGSAESMDAQDDDSRAAGTPEISRFIGCECMSAPDIVRVHRNFTRERCAAFLAEISPRHKRKIAKTTIMATFFQASGLYKG